MGVGFYDHRGFLALYWSTAQEGGEAHLNWLQLVEVYRTRFVLRSIFIRVEI